MTKFSLPVEFTGASAFGRWNTLRAVASPFAPPRQYRHTRGHA